MKTSKVFDHNPIPGSTRSSIMTRTDHDSIVAIFDIRHRMFGRSSGHLVV